MTICLYDIDFNHSSKFSPPNLELMKIFNYYYSQGHIVNLGKPKEDLKRYNQIIYFKTSPKLQIPKSLNLSGANTQIYGYGFFKKFKPLTNQAIIETPPAYGLYDLNMDKAKKRNLMLYKSIKRNSLVRVENMDLTGFKENSTYIYVYDYDFLHVPNAEDFVKEYQKNYSIQLLFPIIADSEEIFIKFFSLGDEQLQRRMVVDFPFSKEFFDLYHYEDVQFNLKQREKETANEFLIRVIKLILYAKSKENNRLTLVLNIPNSIELKKEPILAIQSDLATWALAKDITLYDFLKQWNKTIDDLLNDYKEIRLLSKQNPKTFNTETFDFFEK